MTQPKSPKRVPRSAKKHPAPPTDSAAADPRSTSRLEEVIHALQSCAQELVDLGQTANVNDWTSIVGSSPIAKLLKKRPGPLSLTSLEAIFREVLSGVRQVIQPVRVAYLGPQHSYSHLATLQRFGHSVETVDVGSISAVFTEVENQIVDAGVVPIENSTDGRIVDTLEMFTKCSVKICGEIPMRIHHCLLGRGRRDDIVEVLSKPQALSQCRDWLAHHLPNVRLTATASTSAAAEKASTTPGVAAIASRQAGVELGLEVLAENIEDNPYNLTRFAIIGRESATRTGNDKTALMFELPHQPGALADAMSIFKRKGLNMTWIESFPKHAARSRSEAPQEYLFFVELEGHQKDVRVRKALESLTKKTVRLEILGSYPKA